MAKLLDLSAAEAKAHFLKGSSYFNGDFPDYISFEPILNGVAEVLAGNGFSSHTTKKPDIVSGVNYSFVANKDGRFAWRPYELICAPRKIGLKSRRVFRRSSKGWSHAAVHQ